MQMASRLAVELNAGRQWVQALQQARAEEARQGSLLRQQGQELVASPVVETPVAQAPPPSLPPPHQQQQQSPSRSTTQIFVSLDDVYLCLVNNALGVPIAYVSLLGTDFRLQQQEAQQSSLDLSASVGLRAGTCPFGPSSFRTYSPTFHLAYCNQNKNRVLQPAHLQVGVGHRDGYGVGRHAQGRRGQRRPYG